MRGRTYQEKAYYWLIADRMPLTKLIIVVNIITFLLINFRVYKFAHYIVFDTDFVKSMPWTAFTYPLVTICAGPLCMISAIFSFWWLWFVGGSLERAWGTLRFGLFLLILS
jgi:membrane associated rhomboid family serine protease